MSFLNIVDPHSVLQINHNFNKLTRKELLMSIEKDIENEFCIEKLELLYIANYLTRTYLDIIDKREVNRECGLKYYTPKMFKPF